MLIQWKFYIDTVNAQNERLGINSKIKSLETACVQIEEENEQLRRRIDESAAEKRNTQERFEHA